VEENTGNGVAVVASAENPATGANSASSRRSAKRRTAKTLSATDALQIIQESLRIGIEAVLEIEHGPLPQEDDGARGELDYGIILHSVSLCVECNSLHIGPVCPYCEAG